MTIGIVSATLNRDNVHCTIIIYFGDTRVNERNEFLETEI